MFRFKATLYPCPDTSAERREMVIGVSTRIEDVQAVSDFSVMMLPIISSRSQNIKLLCFSKKYEHLLLICIRTKLIPFKNCI